MPDKTDYEHPTLELPETVRSDLLITTVQVIENPGHDHIHVWNRGGKAGVLTVTKGDGHTIASALLPDAHVFRWGQTRG